MDREISSGEKLFGAKKDTSLNILLNLVIFFSLCYLIFASMFAYIPIEGASMENTIFDSQTCFVQRSFFSVNYNDIITINTARANEKEHMIIKRAIGLGGDKLIFMKSADRVHLQLYRCCVGEKRFTAVNETYIKEKMLIRPSTSVNQQLIESNKILNYNGSLTELTLETIETYGNYEDIRQAIIEIPKGYVYFLGDNRNVSRDSRYFGALPLSAVSSKVIKILD